MNAYFNCLRYKGEISLPARLGGQFTNTDSPPLAIFAFEKAFDSIVDHQRMVFSPAYVQSCKCRVFALKVIASAVISSHFKSKI